MIERIRRKVLKECKQNPEYYHEIDVNRVQTDDYQIERFITEYESEDRAYEEIIKTMKWKREYGIHERNDQYFPKEFYDLFDIEMHGKDREGSHLHWESTKNLIKINDFIPLEQQFIAHRLEKLDSTAGREGWTLVIDTQSTAISNVSLEMWKWKISLLQYFPQGMKRVLIVDLPWILNSIMKIIISFLSPKLRENVSFVKREQLQEYIDPDYIPLYLKGNREKRLFPEDIKPMSELTHLALNEKQIENYTKKHQMMAKRSKSY